jgi:hypothetical protein
MRNLHGDGLAGGKWLLVMLATLIVLLGSISLRRVAPAADLPMGQPLDSGYSFVTTETAAIACNRLEQLQRFQVLSADSTAGAASRYYQRQYPSCRQLKPGKRARVDERRGLFGSNVCIRLEGSARCMWTVRDALRRN